MYRHPYDGPDAVDWDRFPVYSPESQENGERLVVGYYERPSNLRVIRVAVPTHRGPANQTRGLLMDLMKKPVVHTDDGMVYQLDYKEFASPLVHGSREELTAYDNPEQWFDFVMFIDDDMFWPTHEWVIQLAHYNLPIVGGLAVRKSFPHLPCIHIYNEAKKQYYIPVLSEKHFDRPREQLLLQVDSIGMAFTMIRRDVIENIPPPRFFFGFASNSSGQAMGEDVYFCFKAKQMGYRVVVDLGMPVGHIGPTVFDIQDCLQAHAMMATDPEMKSEMEKFYLGNDNWVIKGQKNDDSGNHNPDQGSGPDTPV